MLERHGEAKVVGVEQEKDAFLQVFFNVREYIYGSIISMCVGGFYNKERSNSHVLSCNCWEHEGYLDYETERQVTYAKERG